MTGACAFCGKPVQGNYGIHKTAAMTGKEVPLCDECGGGQYPTCGEIWDRIAANERRTKRAGERSVKK